MMSDQPLHPRLIQANLALFEGDRIEARRLLEEVRRSSAYPAELLLWLEAHTESEAALRLEKLRELAENGDDSNRYTRMAREVVELEDFYARKLRTAPAPRWTARTIVPLILLVVLIVAGGLLLARPGRDIDALQATATATDLPATATPYPDVSIALTGDSYSVRYSAGILTLTAFEDRSQRILSLQTDAIVSPVPGARFYALNLTFECRASICRQPPQADLFLVLDNGDLIEIRSDVRVAGQPALEAIALGRATDGWIIYEIPVLNRVQSLQIVPFASDGNSEPALLIPLAAQ
jgi:hypothetical protein